MLRSFDETKPFHQVSFNPLTNTTDKSSAAAKHLAILRGPGLHILHDKSKVLLWLASEPMMF